MSAKPAIIEFIESSDNRELSKKLICVLMEPSVNDILVNLLQLLNASEKFVTFDVSIVGMVSKL